MSAGVLLNYQGMSCTNVTSGARLQQSRATPDETQTHDFTFVLPYYYSLNATI